MDESEIVTNYWKRRALTAERKLRQIEEYCIPDLMFTECMNRILEIIGAGNG